MKQTTILTIILGVLVIVSIVQVVQLNSMKAKISEGGQLSVGKSSTKAASQSGSGEKSTASLPSSIKDLPQMVGGC